MASSPEIINEFLEKARRRLLRMELGAGMLVGISFLLGLVVVITVVTWVFGPLLISRKLSLILLPFGLLVVVFIYGVLPRLHWRYPMSVARRIEHEFLGDRLELISAIQLQQIDSPTWSKMYSRELVEAHLDQVAQLLREKDPRRLVTRARLRVPVMCLAAALAAALAIGLFRSEAYVQTYQLLLAASAAPATSEGEIGDFPTWLGDIRLNYRYPAYCAREDRTVSGSDGSIFALPGTEVTINARADRPIIKGHLDINGETAALLIDNQHQLTGRLVVQTAGRYRFILKDQGDEVLEESHGHSIQLEIDRPPEVVLHEPAQDHVVRERDSIPLIVEARDDFGLQELRLVYRVLGRDSASHEGEQRRVLRSFNPTVRKISRESFNFELSLLGLAPGEQVQLYIEASDNDTVRGPKTGRSTTRTLKVFSAEQQHRELLTRLITLWERLILLLAGELESIPSSNEPNDNKTIDERVELLAANNLSVWLAQSASLLTALRADPLAFKPLILALANIQQGLQAERLKLERALHKGEDADNEYSPPEIRLISILRQERIQRLERDVLYLEDLLDQLRLDDLQRIAQDLMATEERLHTLLSDYSRAPGDAARQKIESEIGRLKAHMAQLLASQAEVIKGVRDEYLNPEALSKHLQEKDVLGTLDRMQRMLNEGKLSEAMGELERLRQQIQSLSQSLDQSRATYGQGKYAELARELARVQAELGQVVNSQKSVSEKTKLFQQQMLQQMQRTGDVQVRKIFAQLRERLEQVRTQLEGIPPDPLEHFWGADKGSAMEHAHNLDKLLQALDLAGALEQAEGLAMTSKGLERALSSIAEHESSRDPARRLVRDANKQRAIEAARGASVIYDRLRKLLPEANQLLNGAARSRIKKLAQEQAQLRDQLRTLQGQVKRLNQQAPIFGGEFMGGFERGGAAMEQAASKLSLPDPAGAYPSQRSAIAELERLQKGMQNGRGMQAEGMPLPLGSLASGDSAGGVDGNELNREPIEIPRPEEHQAPEAYRKELLEGMKDPVPQDFREQVHRYYEELVK
jgi:hypothetical protein